MTGTVVKTHSRDPHSGDALHAATLVAVVRDGVVPGGPVVPDRHIALLPVPADNILRPGDIGLENPDQTAAAVLLNIGIRMVYVIIDPRWP